MKTETLIKYNEYAVPGDGHLVAAETRIVRDDTGKILSRKYRKLPGQVFASDECGLIQAQTELLLKAACASAQDSQAKIAPPENLLQRIRTALPPERAREIAEGLEFNQADNEGAISSAKELKHFANIAEGKL